jgi:hypothetical protein
MQAYQPLSRRSATSVSFGFPKIGPYYWVGHCQNGINYFAGQTFVAPATGTLKRIILFPSIVHGNTAASLSIYEFDNVNHAWQQKRAEVTRHVSKAMEGQWIDFEIPAMQVNKNSSYAFKLSCNSGGMLAIAECPWNITDPYAEGEEWIGSSQSPNGDFHKDFDLAFEGEIEKSFDA